MKRSYQARVRITPARHGGQGDLPGFLDMMRYDRATVVTWDHIPAHQDGRPEHYVVTIRAGNLTPDRWASFGLVLTDISEVI